MRKELLFAFIAIFFMSLTAITGAYALEQNVKKDILESTTIDFSGDGKEDKIILYGIPYEENKNTYKEFQLTFKLSNGKSYIEKLEYGLNPKWEFVDLTHDGIKDVFVSIPTEENREDINHYLYSMKDSFFIKEALPESLSISGEFTNNYRAKIAIQNIKKPIIFNLKDRKNSYESLGIYQNGRLNEPMELNINPTVYLKPVKTFGNKYILKGVQRVSGTSETDTIANVETSWTYKNHKWLLTKTKVKELKE